MYLRIISAVALMALPSGAIANEWVIGRVRMVEDYRAYDANRGILITLTNQRWYGSATVDDICTARFRLVVGQENITAELQKSMLAMLLTARATGDEVRVSANPNNAPNGECAIKIVSVGDIP